MDQGTAAQPAVTGPSRHIVPRPRLTDLLSASDARVTIVVAPAGYGKTTLVREWLSLRELRAGWFSASDAAIDIAVLVVGLARAASAVLPAIDSTIRERLAAMRESAPDPSVLFDLLAAGLESWPPDAFLVVDDYQTLAGAEITERFLGQIADLPQLKLIIVSRQRPVWATARRLLYGEIREVGRGLLTMTTDEAMTVLAGRPQREVEGLAALADGWPAVIGLAALSESELTIIDDEVPEALHDFLAQELFNAVPLDLRIRLAQLAIPPSVPDAVIQLIGGADARRLLAAATDHGFLAPGGPQLYEMHPLLRRFLLGQLDLSDRDTEATTRQIGKTLTDMNRWDDAFAIAEMFEITSLIEPLIEKALDDLLTSGRLTTLRRWVEYAHRHGARGPQIALADAEIAFREGRYPEAEALARRSARTFPEGHPLVTRAWYRAAQSAHLDDRVAEGLPLHEKAAAHANESRAKQNAIWGQFISRSELDLADEARATLVAFRQNSSDPEDALREAQARISLGIRWDGLSSDLLASSEHEHLFAIPSDPVVKSAYLHMLGCALSLHADYQRALATTTRLLKIADKFRLDFVKPHALYVRSTALIGLRQLRDSTATIRKQARLASALNDQHSHLNSLIVLARIALTQRRPEHAIEVLAATPPMWPTPGLAGEFHAIRALAQACAGETAKARDQAERALEFSKQLETEIPSLWARVVASAPRQRSRFVEEAFARTDAAGHIDTLVLAYRAEPTLLEQLSPLPQVRSRLQGFLEAAHDHALARRIGIILSPPRTRSSLTRRELEVLDLLQQGMSNAEIARALWISEATAKVHVRRVLHKLGVRSRVQAATVVLTDDA